jgi:D-alanyl-D-alanine carboxypeptidase/D-alanyl-D-alanine-endopeptidase (penicillin-binding protein 4)
VLCAALGCALSASACLGGHARAAAPGRPSAGISAASLPTLASRLDELFDHAPSLARAVVGAHVESLQSGQTVYTRRSESLVMPASTMKIVTVAAAADRLGWGYRYRTTLEAAGTVEDGVLHGDLIVTGTGDPSIGSPDAGDAPLFLEWAGALRERGITTVEGRLVGDDDVFDDERLGAGWAWDYLGSGYAAPSGALSYNENVAVIRVSPARTAGQPAMIQATPPGHLLQIVNEVTTSGKGSSPTLVLARLPGSTHLEVRGQVPLGGAASVRTASVDNPTRYFVEALRLALQSRGISVSGGAWDIDDLPSPPAADRRVIAEHESEPLSALAGYAMKVSQNFYGETFFRTLGEAPGQPATAERARDVIRTTLSDWGIPSDALVMYDGSGLSRYDLIAPAAMVAVLRHVWHDERLRGPFVAALPVAGHDGTLASRMTEAPLDRHVEAKTGTINNVRALAGYLDTRAGDKLTFAIIVNNYTDPAARIDAVVEQALALIAESN